MRCRYQLIPALPSHSSILRGYRPRQHGRFCWLAPICTSSLPTAWAQTLLSTLQMGSKITGRPLIRTVDILNILLPCAVEAAGVVAETFRQELSCTNRYFQDPSEDCGVALNRLSVSGMCMLTSQCDWMFPWITAKIVKTVEIESM